MSMFLFVIANAQATEVELTLVNTAGTTSFMRWCNGAPAAGTPNRVERYDTSDPIVWSQQNISDAQIAANLGTLSIEILDSIDITGVDPGVNVEAHTKTTIEMQDAVNGVYDLALDTEEIITGLPMGDPLVIFPWTTANVNYNGSGEWLLLSAATPVEVESFELRFTAERDGRCNGYVGGLYKGTVSSSAPTVRLRW
jgi:hypothetical protein